MENPIRSDYEKAKKEARKEYDTIGRVWSPGLRDYVSFNSVGFWHLMRKGRKRRPHIHQMLRFALISDAKEIITSPSFQISRRKKMEHGRPVFFWAFHAIVGEKNVRVIVRKIGNSHKHFLSAFEENQTKNAS
jgi:hypothetical protein